jgi:hypothetical protein
MTRPPGFGLGRNPPMYLKAGDVVELEIWDSSASDWRAPVYAAEFGQASSIL